MAQYKAHLRFVSKDGVAELHIELRNDLIFLIRCHVVHLVLRRHYITGTRRRASETRFVVSSSPRWTHSLL